MNDLDIESWGSVPERRSAIGGRVSRRRFGGGALAALVAAHLTPAAAQPAAESAPRVDVSDPQEIAPGVFLLRDRRVWLVPNIAVVVGRDAALVVDTGLGPANGERVIDVARRLAPGRRLFLTLTHFHPEHTTGAQVFRQDATIVCNTAQRDEIAAKGGAYVDLFRHTQGRAVADALDGTVLTVPQQTYDGPESSIDLGGRTVQLTAMGMAHTRGDQTVYLPDERILFAGDLIEERMFPIFPWFPPNDTDVDGGRWVRILEGFAQRRPNLIVPGHGDPGDARIASAASGEMGAAARIVRDLKRQGRSESELLASAKSALRAAYPDWEHPDLLDWQIGYYAAQSA